MDIFFYEAFNEEQAALQQYLPAGIKAGFTWKTIQEVGHPTPPAPLISTRTQSHIPRNWQSQLQGIISRSTGYNHLLNYCQQCHTPPQCGYLPLYCHRAVAEQALLLLLALWRRLPQQQQQLQQFNRDGLSGRESWQKKLLVVGVGNIGYEIVRIGYGLEMEVRGVDIDPRHEDVTYVSLEQGLPWADAVVCAMNLTPQNQGMFHQERLQQLQPGALFINISRGEISPQAELLQALENGQLGGVGLDVYHQESDLAVALRNQQPTTDQQTQAALQLARHPRAILTPHNAFNTAEAIERKAEQSAQQAQHFLEHGSFLWPVPSE